MAKADMFLKLDGLTGEANAPEHKDEIEILEWSWGMTGPSALSGGGPSARTSLSEIRFSKGCDKATTQLMSVMRNNTKVKEARLAVRKAGAVPPVEFMTITVKNGRITSHTIGTETPGNSTLVETFSIAFEEIEVKYTTQQGTGGKSADLLFNATVVNA